MMRSNQAWRNTPSCQTVKGLLPILTIMGMFSTVSSQQKTTFDLSVNAFGDPDNFQFTLSSGWAILFSLENVFYDENLDTTPKQAFRVTDANGNTLEPFAIPVGDPQNYLLDMSFLKTGIGLRPFFRGVELTASSLRAWRLDYYKNGLNNAPYTTVMSGIALPIAPDTYMLRIDLGLHWEIEGDAINRLEQGFFSHIALAVADFQSFTLGFDPGQTSGRMFADLPTTVTTATITSVTSVTSLTLTTITATTVTDTAVARVTDTTTETNVVQSFPSDSTTSVIVDDDDDPNFRENCDYLLTGSSAKTKKGKKSSHSHSHSKKGKKSSSKKGKKGKKGDMSYDDCLQIQLLREGEANSDTSKKNSKTKKKAGAQVALEDVYVTHPRTSRKRTTAVVAIIFLVIGTIFLVSTRQNRKEEEDYDYDGAPLIQENPTPTVPMPLRVFGTFKLDIDAEMERMRSGRLSPASPSSSEIST
eukprot:m.335488 g.335488  ORF g.335488 m.335488 type:complete len:473 (+) comp17608_c0_seq1:176-1594(+)